MPPEARSDRRLLTPGAKRRPRRRLAAFGAALLFLAAGFAIGRLAASSDDLRAGGPAPSSELPARSLPAPPVNSMPSVASHTRAGAARAAARALSSLADARLLSSRDRRRKVVSEIAPESYRAKLGPLFDRTYGYLAGILGVAARRGEVVLQMTPLGYRLESFSAARATVAIWQMTLLATPERAPIAAWSTSRAELIWAGGRWRVERFGTDAPGPVPSGTAPSTTLSPSEFVAAARGFSPFGS